MGIWRRRRRDSTMGTHQDGVQIMTNIKRMWHYRWAILTMAMTAFPIVWQAAPLSWQPDVPQWARWSYMAVGFVAAMHTALDHVRDNRNRSDDTDQAGA